MDAAAGNSVIAEKMYVDFKAFTEADQPILVGYRGISEMLMCKHVLNPMSKLNYFRRGKRMLERAIKLAPGNTELIFLRYTTQVNVPTLLNYSGDLDGDKDKLLSYLNNGMSDQTDEDLYTRIKTYMLQSTRLSAFEKNNIKNLP